MYRTMSETQIPRLVADDGDGVPLALHALQNLPELALEQPQALILVLIRSKGLDDALSR